MPLINAVTFAQNTDIATGVVSDQSDYGVSGNPPRSAKANYLLWSKTNSGSNRTFDNPDPGNVLSSLTYNVNTPMDGWYEAILMRFGSYDAGTNYVEQQESGGVVTQYASTFWYSVTNKVYKAIAPSTGQDPTDTNFFEEVLDLSTLIDNTNVEVYIQDIYIKVRSSNCAGEKFQHICGCGCSGDLEKMRPALLLRYNIISADNAFANGNPEQMETIIREVEQTCANC